MSDEAEMNARATQVSRLLQQKSFAEAMALCLQPLPGGGKEDSVKVNIRLKKFFLI
jgi:hypothetical protein